MRSSAFHQSSQLRTDIFDLDFVVALRPENLIVARANDQAVAAESELGAGAVRLGGRGVDVVRTDLARELLL